MNRITHKIYIYTLVFITVFVFIAMAVYGRNYYLTEVGLRHFHNQNEMLKPTGLIGHGVGIIGSFLILTGVFGYMIRKRIRRFSRIGYLKYWLEFHIFLCSLGPVLVLYHTSFKFGGLVAISFWSMVAVVLSGVIGRFIYLQIPRTIQGRELSLNDLSGIEADLYTELKEQYHVDDEILSRMNEAIVSLESRESKNFLFHIFQRFYLERKLKNQFKSELKTQDLSGKNLRKVVKLFKSRTILKRRIEWLSTMQRFLRYWHVAHLPFALVMLVIMIIHVTVAVLFGYKWIF
ncbi:MAG: hypothetical protein JXR71_12615 [Bacteroidales bacterium]|nr:hypothetical protein [Bacteroidales bacterium]